MKRIKSLKDIKNVNLIFEIIINTIFLCHFKKARTKDSFAFFFLLIFRFHCLALGFVFLLILFSVIFQIVLLCDDDDDEE